MLNKKLVLSGVALLLLQTLQSVSAASSTTQFTVSGNITQNTCSITGDSDMEVIIPTVTMDDINTKTSKNSVNNGTIQSITVMNCIGGSSLSVKGTPDDQDDSLLKINAGGAQNVGIAFWYKDENATAQLININTDVLKPYYSQDGQQKYGITIAPVEMSVGGEYAATPGTIQATATLQLNIL